ncbi:MAG: sugar ABC transporter permease [Bacilli bacterium]
MKYKDSIYNPDFIRNSSHKKKHTRSMKAVSKIGTGATYIILVVISFIWLIPFVYLLLQSFAVKFEPEYFIPREFTFNNYVQLFTDTTYPFWKWYLNSFIIAVVTTVFQTILVLLTAYSLSRLRFKGRQAIMNLILILGMFPGFLGMICIYNILKLFCGGNEPSIFSIIIIYCANSAMSYYIAKGFFDTIPKSLDEAVRIDGGNNNTVFWKVIVPMSKPIIIYTILISFTTPWGDFMLASMLAGLKTSNWTVAVGLQTIINTIGNETKMFPFFCAGGVVVSIPIMALFFWLQKYYVEGIAGGAVKG